MKTLAETLLIAGLIIYVGLLSWLYKNRMEVFRKPDFRRILPATRDALMVLAKGSVSLLWDLGHLLLLVGAVVVFVGAFVMFGWSLYDTWNDPIMRRDMVLVVAGMIFWWKLDKLERLLKFQGNSS